MYQAHRADARRIAWRFVLDGVASVLTLIAMFLAIIFGLPVIAELMGFLG